MENTGLSYQSILRILGISSVFLIISFFSSFFEHSSRLYICNEKDRLEGYIRVENKIDILLAPSSDTQLILECIGKGMPYYDRNIEYVLNASESTKKELLQRYTVGEFIDVNSTTVGSIVVNFHKGFYSISTKTDTYVIYKAPQKALFSQQLAGVSIRPPSSHQAIESILEDPKSIIVSSGEKIFFHLD